MNLPIPLEYKTSMCEVRSKKNELLSKGEIFEIDEDFVSVIAKTGDELKVVKNGQPVRLNISGGKLGFAILVGIVSESSAKEMKITNIMRVVDRERRNDFRVELGISARISENGNFDAESESDEARVKAVFIKDLSLNGTKIETSHSFSKGSTMWMQFDLENKTITVQCVVVRKMVDESKRYYNYGCELKFESEADNDRLCAFLFQKQRELA